MRDLREGRESLRAPQRQDLRACGRHSTSMYDTLDQCVAPWTSGCSRRSMDVSDGAWKFVMLYARDTHCKLAAHKETVQESGLSEVTGTDACSCMKHSKTARRRRFRSQSGFYLAILPNGQVMGVKDITSPYIDIDVVPVGADLVKLWGVEAELFMMIDDAGQMRGTDVDSAECVFEEALTESFFNVYYSVMYYQKRWCVGLRNKRQSRGFYRRPKPATDTSFMVEVVHRRSSTSSSICSSSDASG